LGQLKSALRLNVSCREPLLNPTSVCDAINAMSQTHVQLEPFSASMRRSPALLNQTDATDAVTACQVVLQKLLF
jgi:hypothetical protein